ncbi:Mss4-like protein [Cryomyces antarcticus]
MTSTGSAPRGPPWTPPTSTSADYSASCHCGAIAYTLSLSPPLLSPSSTSDNSSTNTSSDSSVCKVVTCTCSICRTHGYLLVYPFRRNVKLERGQDSMKEYRMGSKTKPHFFCKECGSSVWIDLDMPEPNDRLAVNVRLFKDVDLNKLQYETRHGPP